MSQSGRLTTGGGPVPGAGIQLITGNNGAPGQIHGDGAANVNIIGAGIITVTGDGANTLTITSAGAAATFTTDDAIAVVPTAGGNLFVAGGTNIGTTGAVANTVTVNLDDNVVLAGNLTAVDITATHDITATNDIATTVGDIIASGIIYGITGGRFDDQVEITANGLDSTGPTILHDLNRGVVQVDGFHTLLSSEGIDGQILIGSTIGPVAWSNITAGPGIAIVNGHNSIQISANVMVAQQYNTDGGNAVPAAGILDIVGDGNIATIGAGHTVTVALQPSINLAGSLTTGTTITAGTSLHVVGTSNLDGDVTTGAGLLVAGNARVQTNFRADGTTLLVGPVTTNSTLSVGTDALIGNDFQVDGNGRIVGGFTVDGGLTLTTITGGVLGSNNLGQVSASNGNPTGTNGQVIISGPVSPAWANLTAGPGIAITNPAPNNITITATAAAGSTVSSFFARQAANTANVTGDTTGNYIWLGAPGVLTTAPADCFNTGGNLTLGDGAGTSAKYTAPFTGTYFFDLQVAIQGTADVQYISLCINNITQNLFYYNYTYSNDSAVGGVYGAQGNYSIYLHLNAGDQVQFGVNYKVTSVVPLARIVNAAAVNTAQKNVMIQTFISGFKVA